jgi:DNA-binding MarR family transcriptional regulator
MTLSLDACAREVLDVVPSVMRFIRAEMRSHRAPGLSIPQFRALLHVQRNQASSLTSVADHLGLTPATTSALVDGLARRALMVRTPSSSDRRRVRLSLTPSGRTAVSAARLKTQKSLSARLGALSLEELNAITESMSVLRRTFALHVGDDEGGRRDADAGN